MNTKANSVEESYKTTLAKARQWCASEERCELDVKLKLITLDCSAADISKILKQLTQDGFIDELRYAKAYASGKFRISKWGKVKIASRMRMKRIQENIISTALNNIDNESYLECLIALLKKKQHELKSENPEAKRQKMARYALQKGFESELVYQILRSINN